MTLHVVHRSLVSALVLSGVSVPLPVWADASKAQCIAAYESGQRSRKMGELLKAKSEFAHCSSDACPAAMHEDCAGWLSEVSAAIPTALFHVTDARGAALSDVRLSVDGGEAVPLDGRPIAFDPGEHELSFERAGYRALSRRLTFVEGEQSEPQAFVLEPLSEAAEARTPSEEGSEAEATSEEQASTEDEPSGPPAPTVARKERNLVPTLVALGVGALGTAGFIGFGLTARSGDHALDGCIPNCSVHEVDSVRRNYLLSNVSLVVAGAGFIGAGVSFLLAPSAPAQAAKSRARLALRVGPVSYLTGEF